MVSYKIGSAQRYNLFSFRVLFLHRIISNVVVCLNVVTPNLGLTFFSNFKKLLQMKHLLSITQFEHG